MSVLARTSGLVIRPCGDSAFLIELDTLERVLAMHSHLKKNPHPGQKEALAAAKTVLVRAASPSAAVELADYVRTLPLDAAYDLDDTLIEIPVLYDGEDLADVADLVGMSVQGVIDAHTSQLWTAAFGGFAPGFTYCIGQNHSLDVPRRPSPRTVVPAGSVGLAGHFSGIYPRNSPGGWQLLGRTDAVMWDPSRTDPALIAPGNRVRYVAVRELIRTSLPPHMPTPSVENGLRIVATGLQSIVTDFGRSGYADLGVAESGAMDRRAASSANALVGNERGFALLENLSGGLVIQAVGDQVVGVTGADVQLTVTLPDDVNFPDPPPRPSPNHGLPSPPILMSKYEVAMNEPFALLSGSTLTIGPPKAGLRSYVAVRGGLDVPKVLGSAATDLLSGEGPPPLAPGDVLAVEKPVWPSIVLRGEKNIDLPDDHLSVGITLGPRDDWFDSTQIDSLLTQRWLVTDRSNRIGLRLEGVPLVRSITAELPSEGTVAGAIQIPADGQPVLFMRDHPVTGGYPVIGVVDAHELDALAQLPPGATIGFTLRRTRA